MCGIIGYTGSENAVPVILEGLKKLEYRGYDSAGVAVFNGCDFDVVKRKGRLSVLESAIAENPIQGSTGIGHTRWATHGEPSNANSHPHLGGKSKIAIVHNGIIENYRHLRDSLIKKGTVFQSDTDSEVIAALAEHYYNGDIMDTVIKVTTMLEGSYALGIICTDEPDKLIAVKKDNPLIVGISGDGGFIASDIPAILKYTSSCYYLDDKEIAVLTKNKVSFFNTDKEIISKEPEKITWSADSAEKGGYPHFMLKEIFEQEKAVRDTINSAVKNGANKDVIENIDIAGFDKITITACGSAYNAGVVAKYVIERLCGVSAETELASEFRYKKPIVNSKTLVILISQSGETADTIAAMREAKRLGAKTLAIINTQGSTMAKEADLVLFTAAGPEIAVATTKAFSAQLVLLYILAVRFAAGLGRISSDEENGLIHEIASIPEKIGDILKQTNEIQKYAANCIAYKSIFFIGRNIDYAIALEGSLKLKEISYIHSEAYAGGELKHGTISLIEENTLVVALSNCERLSGKIAANAEQVIARGARVLFIGSEAAAEENEKLTVVCIPSLNELFSPSLSAVILQLFAYYVAANKGQDIDKPRNLAKSVTVE